MKAGKLGLANGEKQDALARFHAQQAQQQKGQGTALRAQAEWIPPRIEPISPSRLFPSRQDKRLANDEAAEMRQLIVILYMVRQVE
ncbi:uncharacterized protein TrAFT101_011870 [Trichoderma asperellum]|uniref:uncharacterized protein n=1 Tax=Trichoderma asperellum TaxID=101201 RepID=UPI003323358D|nr:hypothetical protein TrAFT101_011870 [Trichoderma asperellum]